MDRESIFASETWDETGPAVAKLLVVTFSSKGWSSMAGEVLDATGSQADKWRSWSRLVELADGSVGVYCRSAEIPARCCEVKSLTMEGSSPGTCFNLTSWLSKPGALFQMESSNFGRGLVAPSLNSSFPMMLLSMLWFCVLELWFCLRLATKELLAAAGRCSIEQEVSAGLSILNVGELALLGLLHERRRLSTFFFGDIEPTVVGGDEIATTSAWPIV